jgi:hypothetical protein
MEDRVDPRTFVACNTHELSARWPAIVSRLFAARILLGVTLGACVTAAVGAAVYDLNLSEPVLSRVRASERCSSMQAIRAGGAGLGS